MTPHSGALVSTKALIDRVDHLVLTVTDIEVTTRFYERALGMQREFFRGPEGQPRHALLFGSARRSTCRTATPTRRPRRGCRRSARATSA
jgi:catechol 2,3-dioxygenase-like lactoylglutathione lyase family enzyme